MGAHRRSKQPLTSTDIRHKYDPIRQSTRHRLIYLTKRQIDRFALVNTSKIIIKLIDGVVSYENISLCIDGLLADFRRLYTADSARRLLIRIGEMIALYGNAP